MRILFLFLFCFATAPAFAVNGAWQHKEQVSARLVAVGATLNVEIKLADGWRTYGREPGASGIAPAFDFSNSRNAKLGAISYPPARFYADDFGGYNGYEGGVIFAAPLTYSAPAQINLALSIGVCRSLCVPVDFDLSLNLE